MNIVLGASGQVGSAIVDVLLKKGEPVKGVIKDPQKRNNLENKGVKVEIANFFDVGALRKAFQGGDTVFLLTPENLNSPDIIADTKNILQNYREAIRLAGVKKVVGLSSIGAQHPHGTGNLEMSYLLEHSLQGLPVKQIFIRPAYYYSNWLGYLETAKEQGVLPTFFPIDLKIPMAAPTDVAAFIAEVMTKESEHENVYELVGTAYSSRDVATAFGQIVNRRVEAQEIPKEQWKETLQQIGFSDSVRDHFIQMIEAVINGKAKPEKDEANWVRLPTSLEHFLQ